MSIRAFVTIAFFSVALLVSLLLMLGLFFIGQIKDDDMCINSAGKARYRVYKIAYLVERSARGGDRADALLEAKTEVEGFGAYLKALRYGDPGLGLEEPRDPETRAAFSRNINEWAYLRPAIEHALSLQSGAKALDMEGIYSFAASLDHTVSLLEKKSLEKVSNYRKALVGAALLSMAMAVVLVRVFFTRIMAPLGSLQKAIGRMAEGDTECRIEKRHDDEIGLLVDCFNGLVSSLRESFEHRRNLVANIPDAVIELDRDGRVRYANRAAVLMAGMAGTRFEGRDFMEMVAPESMEGFRRYFASVLDGEGVTHGRLSMLSEAEGTKHLEISAIPVVKDGRAEGALIVARDMAGREAVLMELERSKKEAEDTAKKLGKTVEDLEAFARIAVKREMKLKEIKEENLRLKSQRDAGDGVVKDPT